MRLLDRYGILFNKGKKLRSKRMNYAGKHEIMLYATVTKEVAKQIKEGTYTKWLKASEYAEINLEGSEMMEKVLEIKYDTRRLFDTVHPNAYRMVETFIKEEGYKKGEMTDERLVGEILRREKYTGVRLLQKGEEKAYAQTRGVYKDACLIYCLNPRYIKVIKEKDIL